MLTRITITQRCCMEPNTENIRYLFNDHFDCVVIPRPCVLEKSLGLGEIYKMMWNTRILHLHARMPLWLAGVAFLASSQYLNKLFIALLDGRPYSKHV